MYKLFVKNPKSKGPSIKLNDFAGIAERFASSDTLLKEMNYKLKDGVRRLGDSLYETRLVRDAVMTLTGKRFINGASSDKEQYKNLMANGAKYAKKIGLQIGEAPTKAQLKNLKEDMVWLVEEKRDGKRVLVPKVYLANKYERPNGATISANSIDLEVEKSVENSGKIYANEELRIQAEEIKNLQGNIGSKDLIDLSAIKDIVNESGTIKGGAVNLTSEEGDIVNRTAHNRIDIDIKDYKGDLTTIGDDASIISTNGSVKLTAKKGDINNTGAKLASNGGGILLDAGGEVNIKTIENRQSHDQTLGRDFDKGESITHVQSQIDADGLLKVVSGKDTNLEAVDIKAKNMLVDSGGKVNITAVVDSEFSHTHSVSHGSFGSKKSKTDMTLAQSVKGTSIDTGLLVIKGKDSIGLESIDIKADKASISSEDGDVDFTAKSYTNAEYHERKKSRFGGLIKSRSVDSFSEELLADSTAKAEGTIQIAGENISLTATDLITDKGSIQLTAEDKVLITAGVEEQTERHIRESSGIGKGGNAYASSKDLKGGTTQSIKSSHINAGDNLIIKAGSASLIGSQANAKNSIAIKTDVGGIEIKAMETHNTNYSKEEEIKVSLGDMAKSLTDPSSMVNMEGGSVKVKVAEATYDAMDKKTTETKHYGSSLNAGGSVVLDSEEDILIEGSDVSAKADVILQAVDNILIKEATDSTTTDTKETHAKAEVSVAVSNEYAKLALAVKAVDDSRKAVHEAKKSLKKYKKRFKELEQKYKDNLISKEDYEDAKDEKKYYQANVALAVSQLAIAITALETQTTKTATAASESFGTGTSLGLAIDVEGSQTKTKNRSTHSIASNLTGDNIIIDAGGDATIQGSNLNADELIQIDAEDVNIVASRDTSSTSSTNKHIEASLSIDTAGVSGSLSGGMSQTRNKESSYNNSHLNSNNMVINARGNAKIEGAVVNANKELALNVEGDLRMASLQDSKKDKTVGASASVGFGKGKVDTVGVNANYSRGNYRGVKEQTALTGGKISVNVKGDTTLKGVKIDAKDKEGSSFVTGTLTTEDITNQAEYDKLSGGVTYTNSKDGGFSASMDSPQSKDKSQTTHTAISDNIQITINNKENQTQDISTISRDTKNAHHELTEINTEILDIRSKLSDEVSKEGFKAVGDYAMSQAQGEGDEAWEDGGWKKTLAHATMGAVSSAIGGNGALEGASSAGAREASSNLTEGQSEGVQQLVSATVGALAGKSVGAIKAALDGEKFNRQMHQRELMHIIANVEAFAKAKGISKEEAYKILYMSAQYNVDESLQNQTVVHTEEQKEAGRLAHNKFPYTQEEMNEAMNFLNSNVNGETFMDWGQPDAKGQLLYTTTQEQFENSYYNPYNASGLEDNSLMLIPMMRGTNILFNRGGQIADNSLRVITDESVKIAVGGYGVGFGFNAGTQYIKSENGKVDWSEANFNGLTTAWAALAKSPIQAFNRNFVAGVANTGYVIERDRHGGVTNWDLNSLWEMAKGGFYNGIGGISGYTFTDGIMRPTHNGFMVDFAGMGTKKSFNPTYRMRVGRANALGNTVGASVGGVGLPILEENAHDWLKNFMMLIESDNNEK